MLLTFAAVFLKGFQHKNIAGEYLRAIVFTSYLIYGTDVMFVGLAVKNGYSIILSGGTGAAMGMIVSIKYHAFILEWFNWKPSVEEQTQSPKPRRLRRKDK